MRCLFKLAVAVCLAVVAQVLVQPGGVGDEFAFAARVYVGTNFFGIRFDAPEMVDAAARLIERQGHMPECLRKLRQCPTTETDLEEVAEGADYPVRASVASNEELACAR
jgi:hypothetical protein